MRKEKKPFAATWRDLKKPSSKKSGKPVIWRARAKKIFSAVKIAAFILVPVALVAGFYIFYKTNPEFFETSNGKIQEIKFGSDGSLNKKWLAGRLKLDPSSKLSEVDIFEIKQNLEAAGQVRSAVVEKVFPSVLRIKISEYTPFARVATPVSKPDDKTLAISRDGKIFLCQNFQDIEKLPEITGVKSERSKIAERGDFPLAGEIFGFLALAKKRVPDFASTWQSLNISQMESLTLPCITARSSLGMDVVFMRGGYEKQFDRLEYILAYIAEKNISKPKKIDLSLKDRAIADFSD